MGVDVELAMKGVGGWDTYWVELGKSQNKIKMAFRMVERCLGKQPRTPGMEGNMYGFCRKMQI